MAAPPGPFVQSRSEPQPSASRHDSEYQDSLRALSILIGQSAEQCADGAKGAVGVVGLVVVLAVVAGEQLYGEVVRQRRRVGGQRRLGTRPLGRRELLAQRREAG